MKTSPEEQDPRMDSFFSWLKKPAVQPTPDFLERTRQRMLAQSDPVDQLLAGLDARQVAALMVLYIS